MAEVVVSAFLQVLFDKLASPILEDYALWSGAKMELEKLQSSLTTLQAVLEDAEDRQFKDKAIWNWLTKLRDAVYDVDDVLDKFTTTTTRQKQLSNINITPNSWVWVRKLLSFPHSVAFRFKMGLQIKEINERLAAIALERSNFHFREGVTVTVTATHMGNDDQRQQTHSFVIESEIFGRDKDKTNIVEMLINLGDQDDDHVSVIPIVGMGGIGKTTLSQLAFNDVRVGNYFKLRMWVCVSEDFDVMKITKAIIEAATRKKCDLLGMDLMQTRLRETLAGERYLLVLDDIWNEDYEKWDRLKMLLRGGAKGSKIIVTSRSEEVAAIMGTLPTFYLARLSEDDCWSLFKKRAFGIGGAVETPNMVAIGRDIVNKCGGVPLAVKTLGSLMHSRREQHQWLFVKDNEIWKLPRENEGILPALRISYNHLPSYLKRCFAYCAVFPKDHQIIKERLIQMWVAEGFIEPCEGDQQLEDIGTNYFNFLLWRSFFQDTEKDDDGNIVSCKIHDLMHDLAQSIAGTECLIVEEPNSKKTIQKRTRHLSMICDRMERIVPLFVYKAKKLHTFLLLTQRQETMEVPPNFFSTFRNLRVLDLSFLKIGGLPSSLGKLKHLRLLDLSHTDIQILPPTLCSLLNLQTLDLSNCYELQELPKHTTKLLNLRHLRIDRCRALSTMPCSIGKLTSIQTLSKFIVGKKCGRRIEELQWLNLRGELCVHNLENVCYARDARRAKLEEKHNLSSMELSWMQDYVCVNSSEVFENVLEALKPHNNLRRFRLKRYMGMKFPTWMNGETLQNIVEITLKNCRRCEQLPPLGQLPLLKVLSIKGMDAVRKISSEFYGDGAFRGFPSLKHLEFHDMANFEEWLCLNRIGALPCIKRMVVKGCPKLKTMPYGLLSLEELELRDSNETLLTVVATLTSLTTLRICDFAEVRSLQREVENLTVLKSLHIETCDELMSLPEGLSNLTFLESLSVWGCSSLTSLPEIKGLVSLRELSILNCINLSSLADGLQYLTALEKLSIEGCLELVHLPEQDMENLRGLQSLRISHCRNFVSLPVGLQHVTTIKDLYILDFPSLMILPEWLGSLKLLRELSIWDCPSLDALPNAIQSLSSLKYLSIWKCPNLEQRCEREKGEDWHKIAHIPEIHISDREILTQQLMAEEGKGLRSFLQKAKKMKIVKVDFKHLIQKVKRMNNSVIRPHANQIKTVSKAWLTKMDNMISHFHSTQ